MAFCAWDRASPDRAQGNRQHPTHAHLNTLGRSQRDRIIALHEIVYVSLAPEGMTEPQLQALLTNCRLQNDKLGITGVLVYHQREFLQLLEGEADAVTALFDRIEFDHRHQQVYKLWEGPISERSYARWSMAFVDQALIESVVQAVHPSWFSQGLAHSVKDSTGKKLLLRLRDEFLLRHGESC